MNRASEWMRLLAASSPRLASPRPPAAPAGDSISIVERSIREAGIVEFLDDAAADEHPLTLAVNDTHRYTDSRSAIEAICRILDSEGIAPRMRMVVATGSHVGFAGEEKRRHEAQVLGDRAARFTGVEWHEGKNAAMLAPAGGVRVHRWIAESRFSIGIGSMEPHYFAGATGAHKTLSVGVLAYEDLMANHENALRPEAAPLRLKGNPIYEGLAAIIRRMEGEGRRFFAINEALVGGRVSWCAAGDALGSLEGAMPGLRDAFAATLDAPADLVVSVVHPPLDRDLYQADKGIKNVEAAVKDGGVILLDAACAGGVGLDRFMTHLRRAATHVEVMGLIRREGYVLGDHKAARLRALTEVRGVRVGAIAPGLKEEDARAAGIVLHESRESAARWALRLAGAPARVVIADDSGNLALTSAPRGDTE